MLLQLDLSINSQELTKVLDRIAEAFNTEEILDEASALLLNRIRTRFLAKVDPEGNPWVPSKAGLLREKRGGPGTLFKTGRLFRSIQLAGTGPNQRKIATDVPYGFRHQYGVGGLQKRVFLGFSTEDAALVERLLEVRARRILG